MEQQEQNTIPATMELAAAFLAQRCRKDEDFRQRLKSDPKAALQAEMARQGRKLSWPQNMSIEVEENSVQRWLIPIPSAEMVQAFKDSQSQAFTDEQLEQISAGEVLGFVVMTAVGISAGLIAGAGIAGAAVGLNYAVKAL